MQLTVGEGLSLAPPLCEAVQALLARLQEQAAAASAADPLAGMPLPARCHGLLQLLLEVAYQVGYLVSLLGVLCRAAWFRVCSQLHISLACCACS